MPQYILKRPMLLSGLLCAAIAVIGYYSIPFIFGLSIVFCLSFAVLALKKVNMGILFAILLALFMIIRMFAVYSKTVNYGKFTDKTYTVLCTVCDVDNIDLENDKLIVEVRKSADISKGTKIEVDTISFGAKLGQAVTADIKFFEIKENERKQKYSNGIFLVGEMFNVQNEPEFDDVVLRAVAKLRHYIKSTFYTNINYSQATTLCALVFGDMDGFSEQFYSNVKTAGVSHIMVVSGMHLAIMVNIALKASEKIIYNRYFRAVCMVTAVLFLSILCGFTASILRAGVSYLLAAAALILNRHNDAANTLGAATTIVLICSPFTVFSVAFQLSMLSTFGILVIAFPIVNSIKRSELIKSKFLISVISSVLCSLSAMVLTFPIVINAFGYISLVALIPNLLVSPIVTYILGLALIALMISHFSVYINAVIFEILNILLEFMNSTINFFGSMDWSVAKVPQYMSIAATILIIIIFWFLIACKKYGYVVKSVTIKEKYIKEGGRKIKWR